MRTQQDLATRAGLKPQHAMDVGLSQDPLGDVSLPGRQLHRGADVERQIAGPLSECEQRTDGRQRARPGAGCQARQAVSEGLDVASVTVVSGVATNVRKRSTSAR
jgi:hypothetical protein